MHVEAIQEVANDDGLCFQHCRWHWDNDTPSEGYRFIWRDDAGNLNRPEGKLGFLMARLYSISFQRL